jgi:DNA-binding LytR/AlgR family response regulator
MTLKCIIVDDEPMARIGLAEELEEIDFVEVTNIACSSYQALELLKMHRPDLLFLDIEMPGLSGLDLIKSLLHPPMIILVTAYPEYALEGYDLDVIDYLIKPVDGKRLRKACCKAKEFHDLKMRAGGAKEYFFVKHNGKYEKVLFAEVLMVEAADNYVIIYTNERKLMVYDTLKNMKTLLPAAGFMKVHKSFIVALDKVSRVEGRDLKVKGEGHAIDFTIPVSRNLKAAVQARIVGK